MKKVLATACLIGSTFALGACNTTATGDVDIEPPYGVERTATYGSGVSHASTPSKVAPAEKVFRRAQTK